MARSRAELSGVEEHGTDLLTREGGRSIRGPFVASIREAAIRSSAARRASLRPSAQLATVDPAARSELAAGGVAARRRRGRAAGSPSSRQVAARAATRSAVELVLDDGEPLQRRGAPRAARAAARRDGAAGGAQPRRARPSGPRRASARSSSARASRSQPRRCIELRQPAICDQASRSSPSSSDDLVDHVRVALDARLDEVTLAEDVDALRAGWRSRRPAPCRGSRAARR